MKKKTTKKLVLAKETVLSLVEVRGGFATDQSPGTGVLCPGSGTYDCPYGAYDA